MSTTIGLFKDFSRLDPQEVADQLVASQQNRGNWLDTFTEHLHRRQSGQLLGRTLTVWGLNQSEAARLFGVSRQALRKWLEHGIPTKRVEVVADLAAATDLLERYLKRDRIPAVVRQAVPAFGDRSLLGMLEEGDSRMLLEACRNMFSFEHQT